ncbi:translocation and assembly module lipoprotein TamL [Marivirga atlantica]|nr:BamA/TamA family outer membrane protein [Marivirga atlantica]
MVKQIYKITFLVLMVSLSSCVGTRYLEGDEKVLFKQKIKGNQNISTERLNDFYTQEANRRLLLLPISPYVAFYEIGSKNYNQDSVVAELERTREELDAAIKKARENDKSGKAKRLERKLNRKEDKLSKKINEGNLLMRWGEPLAVYDTTSSQRTQEQIELFVKSKGYFDAIVTYDTELKGLNKKRVLVTYKVQEGTPHFIDTIFYNAGQDTTIQKLLVENRNESILTEGQKYDQAGLSAERERIEILLKNNGYYAFTRQFVEFNVYQSPDTNNLQLEVLINKPVNKSVHKQFKIDKVNFTTDVNSAYGSGKRNEEVFNRINYYYYKPAYKKKILDQRVFIRPNQLYSLNSTFNTQRQLGNLDMFRFVNVKYDTAGGNFIANIFTSPLDQYQISNEVGLNVNVSYGFPGPFYNASFKNRNPFGGIEILELSGRVGLEGVANFTDQTAFAYATEARLNLTLTFPHFLFPLGNELKSTFALLNPKTKTGIGYNYTDRPEYDRSNFNASFGYSWMNRKDWIYDLRVADLNVIQSDLTEAFSKELRRLDSVSSRGSQLERTFRPSFVSSSFINIAKNFNNYGTDKERASFLKYYFETGGNLLNFKGVRQLSEKSNLEFYQFLKSSVDFRHYFPYGRESTFAFRINMGAAKPYGAISENTLPYEKYFFAGGSSSIRAWAPRRLGPGNFAATDDNGELNYDFEQFGEIIFETSVEVRRNLVNFLDGALFVDAGNIWVFDQTPEREGANFEFNRFYKEIAIGTGAGLRIDFSFLILRLDIGFKLYDPAQPEGERWTADKWNLAGGNNYSPTYNIGIGYPF